MPSWHLPAKLTIYMPDLEILRLIVVHQMETRVLTMAQVARHIFWNQTAKLKKAPLQRLCLLWKSKPLVLDKVITVLFQQPLCNPHFCTSRWNANIKQAGHWEPVEEPENISEHSAYVLKKRHLFHNVRRSEKKKKKTRTVHSSSQTHRSTALNPPTSKRRRPL